MNFLIFLGSVCTLLIAVFLVVLVRYFFKKSSITGTLQVQCSSGDAEVMTFNYNFVEGELDEEKKEKIQEAFRYIDERREETHQKMVDIRRQSMIENQEKLDRGEKLALRSELEAAH